MNCKYSRSMLAMHQKILHHAKQSATDALKIASKRANQVTGNFIGG